MMKPWGQTLQPSFSIALATLCSLVACAPTTTPDPVPDEREAWGQVELPATQCVGNGDGVLEASELVLAPELTPSAAFLVDSADASVLLPASRWDLDFAPSASDSVVFLGPETLADAWFAGWFTDGQFSALTDFGGSTRTVYSAAGGALLMLGAASEEPDASVLRYEPAIPVMPVPMQVGDAWTADVEAEGVHEGQEYPADFGIQGTVTLLHHYDFEVVDFGTVSLPAADLPVLLLRIELITEAHNSLFGVFASESVRLDLFVAECLGVVARIRSHPDEPSADFGDATEVMRLGLEPELLP